VMTLKSLKTVYLLRESMISQVMTRLTKCRKGKFGTVTVKVIATAASGYQKNWPTRI
jgi:hypothetical protein